MKTIKLLTLGLFLGATLAGPLASAVETAGEKIEAAGNKAADSVKSTVRKGKDKTCEMVDGKMSCAGKKMKHKMQDASDSAKSKASEVKNKVDK